MKPVKKFTAHDGTVFSGERLYSALAKVADDWREIAERIYQENAYAAHVTEDEKRQHRDQGIEAAERIRAGYIESMTIAQRVDAELTGECVGILP